MLDEELQARTALEQAKLQDGMRHLLSKPEGVELARWIVNESCLLRAGYSPNADYAQFLEGKRTIGAALLCLAQQVGQAEKIINGENNG